MPGQGIEVNIFARLAGLQWIGSLPASATRLSHAQPMGRSITGSPKSPGLDKTFQQINGMSVLVLPILTQAPRDLAQEVTSLDVCTPEMARKEFYAGLLAYSLVRAVMWGAGARLEGGVKTISFSQARRTLLERLKDWGRGLGSSVRGMERWTKELLEEVTQQTLPKRRKARLSEIRRVRHRRQKFPLLKGSRAAARA